MMAEGGIPDPLLCVCKCVQESGGQEKREERKTDYQNTLIMLMTFFSPLKQCRYYMSESEH